MFRRDDFINCLKVAYITIKRDNLKIFGISRSKTLQDFVTTEKDVQKGLNRLPLNLARLIEEDILSDAEVAAGKQGQNQMDQEMSDPSSLKGGVYDQNDLMQDIEYVKQSSRRKSSVRRAAKK